MGHGILNILRVIIKGSSSPSHLYGRGRVNPSVAADSTCKAPGIENHEDFRAELAHTASNPRLMVCERVTEGMSQLSFYPQYLCNRKESVHANELHVSSPLNAKNH